MPNPGLGLDAFHLFAADTPLAALEMLKPHKIFLA